MKRFIRDQWMDSCVEGGDGEMQSTEKLKNSFTAGFEKLIKSLSQYFVLYQGKDKEVGMEIARIGREGFDSPEFLSFSLKQFELAMVAHVGAPPPHGPDEVLLTRTPSWVLVFLAVCCLC